MVKPEIERSFSGFRHNALAVRLRTTRRLHRHEQAHRVFTLLGKGGFRVATPETLTVGGVVVSVPFPLYSLTYMPNDGTVVLMYGVDGFPPVSLQHVDEAFLASSTYLSKARFYMDNDGDLVLLLGETRAVSYATFDADIWFGDTKIRLDGYKPVELHGDLIAYRYKKEWHISEKSSVHKYYPYTGDEQHCWDPPKYGTDLSEPL